MIDTSALVAALISGHEYHALARPRLAEATRVPAIVLAETFSQLRRTFGQSAAVSSGLLSTWWEDERKVLPTSAVALSTVLGRARELDLGGNVHDALIAQVCRENRLGLVTVDARQHRLALALGVESTYLPATA
ncbi:MAG TPA: PIN domain-containing protein [Acidimicrobiales bacterium]|nr:PIN domain-containing protein [Acidimicrobiales bacterium]